jgi:hypothetical protein
MSNKFCRYLSNGYTFVLNENNSNVAVYPCCLFRAKDGIQLNSQLLENRKFHYESINDWTDNCISCKVLEDANQLSLRQAGDDWISDEQSQDPVSIDIRLDSECNAACVICGQETSSLWRKENLKLYNKTLKLDKTDTFVDKTIDQIINTVSLAKLKYVKFFGGEPLFTDTHLKFIRHIPHPEQVTLHYTTNGSIYPNDEVLETWKKFKTVVFAASLDGIEEQFDYVRWPLPWNKVSKNLIRLQENKDICNLIFRVEFTANFLNAYYFDRLENWVVENFNSNLSGDTTEINIHPCYGVWDLDKMPAKIRELVMEKYPKEHRIHSLVDNLSPPTSLIPWENFVNIWDRRRNNSWQTAFPDLVQYL